MVVDQTYYAVIFTSVLSGIDIEGYQEMSDLMLGLAEQQEGFLGFESAREKIGISVSYWKDIASIKSWKSNLDHIQAQQLGKEKWYKSYVVRICKVEQEYSLQH